MMTKKEENPLATVSAEKLVSVLAVNLKLPIQFMPSGVDVHMLAAALVVAAVPYFTWSRDNLGLEPSVSALIEALTLPSLLNQGRDTTVVLPDHIHEGREAYLKLLKGGMDVNDPTNRATIIATHQAAANMAVFTMGTLFAVLSDPEMIAEIEERLDRVVPQRLLDTDIDDYISAPN
jgi:hypothetical protein